MNKEEAKIEVEKWKRERKKVHCSMGGGNLIDLIFGKNCKVNCECMIELRIQEISEGGNNWIIIGGYCTCHSLTGSVQ